MSDRHIRRAGDEYRDAFLELLPQGQAWPKHSIDSVLWQAVDGLCKYWGYVDSRAADLLEIESDPRKTLELLPDWERNWGLPDPCYAHPLTIAERQRELVMRMTLLGGQSRQFYIDAAAYIGYDISITEYRPFIVGMDRCGDNRTIGSGSFMRNEDNPVVPMPILNPDGRPVQLGEYSEYPYMLGPPENRFFWTVHVHIARLEWFRVGPSGGEVGVHHHLEIGLADDLECLLRRWKPAHTEIIFDYSNLMEASSMAGTP
ncbi:uncharacterized protein YmfQ (DUF2313 family) [Bradyrhizobium barranii subsp. barranii]|uniref:YmfQ family protein n=1 Tax=Bradyrhizobium TaxID=374 RepID=UPI001BA581D1|nr:MULTISPECIES: putative phage tail protein [Bradyrhizobium]MBR0879609.1 DUF2313 domain-containing protein [Bradyrhizobium liaoningense]MCP1778839.1 uncharacterized protein YmfQ (DUF2313 family) [Bradyrhizobium japonicum]MCP1958163.1 uncharacterized protein YmfQ (DUF2313 family) [Bradyrhizobium japonicum]